MTTKVCSRCKEKKALTEFGVNKQSRDGCQGKCKLCANELASIYRKNNPDKVRESKNKWIKENLEVEKIRRKKRFQIWSSNPENREKQIKKVVEWQKNNREKFNANSRLQTHYLSDSYVRKQLKLTKDQAPPELIELKRTHLQITRYLMEAKK